MGKDLHVIRDGWVKLTDEVRQSKLSAGVKRKEAVGFVEVGEYVF
jgi:hypothetical protein